MHEYDVQLQLSTISRNEVYQIIICLKINVFLFSVPKVLQYMVEMVGR